MLFLLNEEKKVGIRICNGVLPCDLHNRVVHLFSLLRTNHYEHQG